MSSQRLNIKDSLIRESFIKENIDMSAKGKNIESLKKSRKIRADWLNVHGQIPSSILRYERSKDNEDPVVSKEGRRYTDTHAETDESPDSQSKKSFSFHISGSGVKKGALSTFPHNIGRMVTEVYSNEGDIIYDPFAGHNSRMQMCFEMNRHYYGIDVSSKFMRHNRKVQELLLNGDPNYMVSFENPNKTQIVLHEGSSDNCPWDDCFADFTITSPPYWDIEYYGPELEQLGRCKTYTKFIELLTRHMRENFRVLKPGAYCAWFINDFRRKAIFYPYHIDTYQALVSVGFIPISIYIIDLGPTLGECFLQKILETKIFAKRHEYCVLVQKPGGKDVNTIQRTNPSENIRGHKTRPEKRGHRHRYRT